MLLRRSPLTLRTYLLLLVLGALAPGALLTSILVSRTFAANRTLIERRLLDAARIDAAALDREFEGTIRALQALATSPALDTGNLEMFYPEARRVRQAQASWYSVVVLSLDGQQLLNAARPWGEALPKAVEPDSLQQVVVTQQPIVGRVRPDPRTGRERRFAIRVPVIRNGQLKYVLTASIDIESLASLVRAQGTTTEEWTRVILDPDGTVAASSRDGGPSIAPLPPHALAQISQLQQQVPRPIPIDGTDMSAAISRAAFGWTAVVLVPTDMLDAAARGSTTALLTGGALLTLCGLLAVLGISRRLQRDFMAAGEAADDLAHGRPMTLGRAHVAESHRLRESLYAAAALLQQRQHERDQEIARAEAARGEAEQANRTKDQFLAVLGHELRNPLAPAITAIEMMKLRDPQTFVREREVLERQLAHMVRLVNDLLDVSRLARGKVQLHVRRFELRDAIDRAVDMARPLIEQHGHRLRVAVPANGLPLDADEDRIVQVLVNLLTNAAKYTPPKGHIALEAQAVGRTIEITCEDNGPGVPADLMAALFEPFEQGPRTLDRQHGGLGLGLALARSLTQLHGGTIQVENRTPGPGARFIVHLPIAAGQLAVAAPETIGPPSLKAARRVLVVDDNPDITAMLARALVTFGQTVMTAADGPTAITVAATFQPEIAILDIGLPGMNGYELAVVLRREYPGIRLISLTGYGQPADAEAAARAGFDVHLVKPVRIATLLEQLDVPNTHQSVSSM